MSAKRRSMVVQVSLVFVLCCRIIPSASADYSSEAWNASIVTDINLTPTGSSPQNVTIVGNLAFFTATDGVSGVELWVTDGTEADTMVVKDIFPGPESSSPEHPVDVDGTLFFTANDGLTGQELWKTDGSEKGTVLVKDIQPGRSSSSPRELIDVNGILFFVSNGSFGTGEELWMSDGSAEGTVTVKDINPESYCGSDPDALTNVNGTLFFTASDGFCGRELWKSDGTLTGTVLVRDIDPKADDYSGPESLAEAGGMLFFTANDGLHGRELWKSDGTANGTVLVKDVDADTTDYSGPENLTYVNGTVFFMADDGEHGRELWMSDGTDAGTVLVKDLSPGSSGSSPSLFTPFRGDLYFHAYAAGFSGLFKSDGTEAGTFPIADVSLHEITVVGQSMFLAGRELWCSDGTTAGTTSVKDVYPGPSNSYPSGLRDFNGQCLFSATNMDHGRELWISDGTEQGTGIVKDIHTLGTLGSNPSLLTNYQDTLYFWATSGERGLWKSDGSMSGTEPIVNQTPPSKMIQYNDMLCYVSRGRLYASDGTASGTYDWFKGTGFQYDEISQFVPYEGVVDEKEIIYFSIEDRLYKTYDNGDCVLVKEINTSWDAPIEEMTPVHSTTDPQDSILFFSAYDGSPPPFGDRELFVSDGTSAGTKMVLDIGGSANGDPQNLTNVNGTCFFHASDGNWSSDHGRELWKSDGTAVGTMMVKDITPGREDTDFGVFISGGEQLYFVAEKVLWTSDGTSSGTYPLVHFEAECPVSLGDRLFFIGCETAHRGELWISDGMIAGTLLLAEVVPGLDGLEVQNLVRSGDRIVLVANGSEIWETDGTEQGTVLLADVGDSAIASSDQFTAVNGDLFFAATDVEHGRELWKSGDIESLSAGWLSALPGQ